MLTRFEPSYRLVQEVEREIEQAQASIAAEALTPMRDESSDKDPNYEWARMELEKARVRREACERAKPMPSTRSPPCDRWRNGCRPTPSTSRT